MSLRKSLAGRTCWASSHSSKNAPSTMSQFPSSHALTNASEPDWRKRRMYVGSFRIRRTLSPIFEGINTRDSPTSCFTPSTSISISSAITSNPAGFGSIYRFFTQLWPAPPGLPVRRIPTGTPLPLRRVARSLSIGAGEGKLVTSST